MKDQHPPVDIFVNPNDQMLRYMEIRHDGDHVFMRKLVTKTVIDLAAEFYSIILRCYLCHFMVNRSHQEHNNINHVAPFTHNNNTCPLVNHNKGKQPYPTRQYNGRDHYNSQVATLQWVDTGDPICLHSGKQGHTLRRCWTKNLKLMPNTNNAHRTEN